MTLSASGIERSTAEHFRALADRCMLEIEAKLLESVPYEPRLLYDPVRHILSAGGKRVRPLLTAFSAMASQPESKPNWLPAGVAVELLHTFTLVHDDIMDNAETRRGKPAVHVAFGRDAAILSGDVIIALGTSALAESHTEHGNDMLREFGIGFVRVCEGQALDKDFERREDIGYEDYVGMIRLKTASIFELAIVLGAYAAGGHFVSELRMFAHHLGIAFQMTDDLLDLTADEMSFGKPVGGDILEGKRTLLYVEAMRHYASMTVEERSLMDRISGRRALQEDIESARSLFGRLGVLERTQSVIENETRIALESLRRLPDSEYRDGLALITDDLLLRRR